MTAATGFKRLGFALGVIFAAGIGALGIMSLLIPADTVREAVKSEIRAVTGLDPVLRGPVSVSLFPSGTISFDDVILGGDRAGDTALAAERLTARLRFFPLLAGNIQVADITLVRPTIAVTFEPGGRSNWTSLVETLAAALRPNENRSRSFSEIRIDDGTVLVRDEARGIAEKLTAVDLSLAWPSISQSFAATGRFDWRDEPVDASISLADFIAALAGDPSGIKLRLNGNPLKLAFDGHLSTRPTLKIEGTLAADAKSLREALRWTAQKSLPGGGFGRFALKAKTNVVGGMIALSGVNVELDGNAAEGVLTFASDGRQMLQGTLAAEGLDLSPYVSTVRLMTGNERDWNGVPIVLDSLTGVDLDLRLSAAQVTISGAKLGRTALAANLRGGRLSVTIGESQAFGGLIKGSLGLARSDAGADLKAHLQFADVDLDSCLGALFGMHRLDGKGNLAFNIEGSGGSVMALTKTLNGSATLTSRQGAVTGFNVEQLLRRLERRPLSGSGDFRTGRTPYDTLAVTLGIKQGTVTAEDVHIDGAAVRLAMAGTASIPARDLDLKGVASLVSASTSGASSGFELPFMVQGAWDDPILLPDTQSLLRRSGAAAPLLDALRDRQARDAGRAAIDRLIGNPAAPVPANATPQ
ncbi:MAG: AsmA protein [Alphaproteobacteria bacterium]|nr:AsmA protein [Alphaproteobacteria bacterium]